MTLPVNVDATYPDASPGDAAHQQHHDLIHSRYNVDKPVALFQPTTDYAAGQSVLNPSGELVKALAAFTAGAAYNAASWSAPASATYVPLSGAKTLTGQTRLETNVTTEHPLTVWADKGDGLGMLERFTVENTAGGGGCDMNFRSVDLNIGLSTTGAYDAHIKMYAPTGSATPPIRIFKAGSTTDAALTFNRAGSVASYAKGLASGACFSLATWGDANQTFAIGAPDGKI